MESSPRAKFTVAGKLTDPLFHKCVVALNYLQRTNTSVTGESLAFFPCQWDEYLKDVANKNKGVFYTHIGSPLVILNDTEYIGDCDKFMNHILYNFHYQDNTPMVIYSKKANDFFKNKVAPSPSNPNKYAFINFQFGGNNEQVVFELFFNIAPKTVDNFLWLCGGFMRED